MTVSNIVAKVLDSAAMRTSSAYSRVLSAGPILKARSMSEPNEGFLTVLVILLAVLGALRLWVRWAWFTPASRIRPAGVVADEEMAWIGESFGTTEEDEEGLEMKRDVNGADFA